MALKVAGTGNTTVVASQLRKGIVEYCVLGLLRARSMYGRELAIRLTRAPGLVASEGSVYPILTRLRRVAWVASSWVDSPAGPPRRYYELTKLGEEALLEFRNEWGVFRTAVESTLTTGANDAN